MVVRLTHGGSPHSWWITSPPGGSPHLLVDRLTSPHGGTPHLMMNHLTHGGSPHTSPHDEPPHLMVDHLTS